MDVRTVDAFRTLVRTKSAGGVAHLAEDASPVLAISALSEANFAQDFGDAGGNNKNQCYSSQICAVSFSKRTEHMRNASLDCFFSVFVNESLVLKNLCELPIDNAVFLVLFRLLLNKGCLHACYVNQILRNFP